MKKPKANREDGIQASINKMLRGLASNGIIVLERLQSSWNTLKAAGAAEQKRFIAGLEATGIKICTGCADWLRIKQQWQLDVHLVTAAGPTSPTKSQNNIGGISITEWSTDLEDRLKGFVLRFRKEFPKTIGPRSMRCGLFHFLPFVSFSIL